MKEAALIILALVAVIVGGVFMPFWRLRRASRKVIRIFRQHQALDAKSAKAPLELGFKPPSMLEGFLTRRNYNRYALDALMRSEIVQATEDGELFLSEEKLQAFTLARGKKNQPGGSL